jgi:hypothetical protein
LKLDDKIFIECSIDERVFELRVVYQNTIGDIGFKLFEWDNKKDYDNKKESYEHGELLLTQEQFEKFKEDLVNGIW